MFIHTNDLWSIHPIKYLQNYQITVHFRFGYKVYFQLQITTDYIATTKPCKHLKFNDKNPGRSKTCSFAWHEQITNKIIMAELCSCSRRRFLTNTCKTSPTKLFIPTVLNAVPLILQVVQQLCSDLQIPTIRQDNTTSTTKSSRSHQEVKGESVATSSCSNECRRTTSCNSNKQG